MTFAEQLKAAIGPGEVYENEPMKYHTTFRIGGPADILACPQTEEGLVCGLKWCQEQQLPFYIIGNGSNLLVGDKGFRGVIFKLCKNIDFFETEEEAGKDGRNCLRVRAGAGIMLAKLARDVSSKGYTGFEFATGIPGTLGGAVTMNAGAYGGEMKQVLVSVRVADRHGEIYDLSAEALELGYRTSRIQKDALILLSAEMVFESGDADAISARVEELSQQRRAKQPLEYPSAGSTFKRPEGYFAGKLIQDTGLKGYRVGDAQVSEKHSGFVINTGEATAAQVRQLMADVDAKVYEKFHVHLEPEVRMIGEF
jgi:UDP-N-acetylmuramate dehydrogenase